MTPAEALQATLAGEHAAVYVFGVLGARTSRSREPGLWEDVREAYTTHRARRDQLVAIIRQAADEPVAAEVSYEVPTPARSAVQVAAAALAIEQRCCARYADMVMSTAQAQRQWAIDALADAAVRQLRFGGEPEAFPGVPEL